MTRRFEFKDVKSNKFWEITVKGKTVTVQYGRIGTDGQTQVKEYTTPAEAEAAAEKQIAEKVKKGYCEIDADGADETPEVGGSYIISVQGEACERFIGIVDLELLTLAIASGEDDFDAALSAIGVEWFTMGEYLHDHGLHRGTIRVLRGDREVHMASVAELLGASAFGCAEEIVGNLRFDPAGFYYVRFEWEGSIECEESSSFDDVSNWADISAEDVHTHGTAGGLYGVSVSDTGLIQEIEHPEGLITFSDSAEPAGHDSVLVFSRGFGRRDLPQKAYLERLREHCEVVTLESLRESIRKSTIDVTDQKEIAEYLATMVGGSTGRG